MTKFCFGIILFVLIFSCNKQKDKVLTCEEQREKAKTDFKNKKYTYFEFVYRTDSIFSQQEFKQLLKNKNINVVFDTITPAGCIPDIDKDLNHYKCYQEIMNIHLNAEFGRQFFDSLRSKAQVMYLQRVKKQK